ncbi:MAG: glycosyltransferase family 4 protein [Saprospiraceae bacterium]|nr:glycosyltransferase family 4 protein [Saprospiraceae bacterium]
MAKMRGKKITLTLRGGKLPEFYARNTDVFNKAMHRADCIQTPSKYLQQYFQNTGLNIDYLPNSINLTNFPYNGSNRKEQSLLWVRAFSSIYNPDLAVRILHEIRKIHPDATLTMIGPDKGELQSVQALINRLGLQEAVSITGPVPNDQLFRYFHSHSVFLNTTSYESFGVAVMEAAACGIPVVSTSVGEIPYLWQHGENILMVGDFDAASFAAEVKRLLESKELALKISKSAREKAETFNWEVIKDKWIKLFSK